MFIMKLWQETCRRFSGSMPDLLHTFLGGLTGLTSSFRLILLVNGAEWPFCPWLKDLPATLPTLVWLLWPLLSLCLKPSKGVCFTSTVCCLTFTLRRVITGLSQWVGVFIIKQTWHNGFIAVVALGGIIIGMTFSAQQHIIFGCECFIHQRAAALGTVEALVMPMTILVRQIL